MSDGGDPTTRRALLRAVGAAGTGALAGCPAFTGDDERTRTFGVTETTADPGRWTTLPEGPPPLEVLHRWRAGRGRRAYERLLDGFRERHPALEFLDTTRTTGLDLERVVRDRLREGTPPSTWQAYPGANLTRYAGAGSFRNLTGLWDRTGLTAAVPPDVRTLCSLNGAPVTVPLSVHRVNTVLVNRAVLRSAGVSLADVDSPDALVAACRAVDERTDAVAFDHVTGSATGTLRLWAALALGVGGADAYRRTVGGAPDEATIRAALARLRDLAASFPPATDERQWFEVISAVVGGRAAFAAVPGWGAGSYSLDGDSTENADWVVVPFPGTERLFVPFADTFPFPTDNPTPEGTTAFLRYLGSTAGQTRFCRVEGSVPPRTDVDPADLTGVARERAAAYATADAHPPTLAYGAAVRPSLTRSVGEALAAFLDGDTIDATATRLRETFDRAF